MTATDHSVAAEAIGGYFLLWPLFVCGRVQCVPSEQKSWVRGRLKYVSRTYGIDGIRFLDRQPRNYLTRGINLVNDPEPDRWAIPPEEQPSATAALPDDRGRMIASMSAMDSDPNG